MSLSYQAVTWNRHKKIYDGVLLAGVTLYLGVFLGLGSRLYPDAPAEILWIRGFGTAALLLLHVILSIGPLCRLDPRFVPLLYNRRHLGVTMFFLALVHGGLSLVRFHGLGDVNPLSSVLAGNLRFDSLSQFPFQPLGFLALVMLFLMAATSHDFWLANLSAPVWKSLHMLVYVAYALIVLHVVLGVLQTETRAQLAAMLGLGMIWIFGLHLATAFKERAGDREVRDPAAPGFVEVCAVSDIAEKRARVVTISGERVAVFRYDGKISALSNVCQHQNGPLGEGRIVNGLVVCPWHGYEYRPDCGLAPEPYRERVPTFRVRVRRGRVWVDPRPNPPGTRTEPARIDGSDDDG